MYQVVHKFGGSSLANEEGFKNVWEILKPQIDAGSPVVAVVSAPVGVTDDLYDLLAESSRRRPSNRSDVRLIGSRDQDSRVLTLAIDSLKYRLRRLIEALLPVPARQRQIQAMLYDLKSIHQQLLSGSPREADIVTFGEIWSARLLNELARACGISSRLVDPRRFLAIDQNGSFVDAAQSKRAFLEEAGSSPCAIVPGFLAVDAHGRAVTLQRGGSDFSAGLLAGLLQVQELSIWTDVEGIRSADPDVVKNTRLLPYLSYKEASRFARNGAGVLHPRTLEPVTEQHIPVFVRSSLKPGGGKTQIGPKSSGAALLGLTSIAPCSVVIGRKRNAPFLKNIFDKEHGLTGLYLEQDASAILIVPMSENQRLFAELSKVPFSVVQNLEIRNNMTLITAIHGARSSQHVPYFKDLPPGVELISYSDGEVEYLLVHRRLAKKAMISLHDQFVHGEQSLAVALVGVGNVGRTLIKQIQSGVERTFRSGAVRFSIKALANSRRMLLSHEGIDLDNWKQPLDEGAVCDLDTLTSHMERYGKDAIIIDATASEAVAHLHGKWLELGLNVITANKISCSGDHYSDLMRLGQKKRVKFLFETTVGAGLPVINVARNLVESGDRLIELEAILSGSLSCLSQKLEEGWSFSTALKYLHDQGLTEPDPRLDLSGLDVARKLVILARQFQIDLRLADIDLCPVIDSLKEGTSLVQFLADCEAYNEYFADLLQQARGQGYVLRYLARLTASGQASVGLASLPKDHCFARLNPADNVIQFMTERYQSNPLIVRGPGAGREVTAAGLYSDMLRLAWG